MSAGDALLTTSVAHRDGAVVLSVSGEIDAATASVFDAAVAAALAEDPLMLIIELSAVTFMGSVGLRILLSTKEETGNNFADFAVVAHDKAILRPIQLAGLHRILSMYSSLEDALAAPRKHMA